MCVTQNKDGGGQNKNKDGGGQKQNKKRTQIARDIATTKNKVCRGLKQRWRRKNI